MATRKRTDMACVKCKAKKARCSDYRPCHRCIESDPSACEDFSAVATRSLSTIRSILTGSSNQPCFGSTESIPDLNAIWQRLPLKSAEIYRTEHRTKRDKIRIIPDIESQDAKIYQVHTSSYMPFNDLS